MVAAAVAATGGRGEGRSVKVNLKNKSEEIVYKMRRLKCFGLKFAICCCILSAWGIIQLGTMEALFHARSIALLDDVPEAQIKSPSRNISQFYVDLEAGYDAVPNFFFIHFPESGFFFSYYFFTGILFLFFRTLSTAGWAHLFTAYFSSFLCVSVASITGTFGNVKTKNDSNGPNADLFFQFENRCFTANPVDTFLTRKLSLLMKIN